VLEQGQAERLVERTLPHSCLQHRGPLQVPGSRVRSETTTTLLSRAAEHGGKLNKKLSLDLYSCSESYYLYMGKAFSAPLC